MDERIETMTLNELCHRRHINDTPKTNFANSGRAAGAGIIEDRYDEESGNPSFTKYRGPIRFPSDCVPAEELNGPVIVYKGREKR